MDRYVSPALQVPAPNELSEHDRIDLELRGVDHSGGSYAVRVFVNDPEADAGTALDGNDAYAGSFYVFGHGACLGDEGHCDVRRGPINPYDYRLPHQLTLQYHRLEITDAIRGRVRGETFAVTLVAVENRNGHAGSSDLMAFTRVSVVGYS
jgi:tyrosinase